MSVYYHVEDEDITFNADSKDIDLHVLNDEWGSINATISFEQIKRLAVQIEESEGE